MAISQVKVNEKADLIGSYYVKPQGILNSIVADPLISPLTHEDLNFLVVSVSEMWSFSSPFSTNCQRKMLPESLG